MQCTLPSPVLASSSEITLAPSERASAQVAVSTSALLAAFASAPDPRRRQGTRFPLPAILALAVAAILSHHISVLAIAEWGAGQGRDLRRSLGFLEGVT